MTVYSERFVGPLTLAGGFTSIHTVPADETHILMTLSLVVGTPAAGASVTLLLNGTGTGNRLWRRLIVADTTLLETDLRLVLEAGDVLHSSGTSAAVLTLCGYRLENT